MGSTSMFFPREHRIQVPRKQVNEDRLSGVKGNNLSAEFSPAAQRAPTDDVTAGGNESVDSKFRFLKDGVNLNPFLLFSIRSSCTRSYTRRCPSWSNESAIQHVYKMGSTLTHFSSIPFQLHKELQQTMSQLEAIRYEIRSGANILVPGSMTNRLATRAAEAAGVRMSANGAGEALFLRKSFP